LKTLEFLPEALREYAEAVGWYEEQRPGLGAELATDLEARLEQAARLPGAGRLATGAPQRFDLRWYELSRFPYALLIGTMGERRLVVAVAHVRRHPTYWRRRLGA